MARTRLMKPNPLPRSHCLTINDNLYKIGNLPMDRRNRRDIRPGLEVEIVLKKDQRTGKLTRGVVKDILTKSANHPHGIKVRLTSGLVGRVKIVH